MSDNTKEKSDIELIMCDGTTEKLTQNQFKYRPCKPSVISININKLDINKYDNFIFTNCLNLTSIYGNPPNIETKDLSYLFNGSKIKDGNLNEWDVSKVDNMTRMFYNSKYDKPLDKWKTNFFTSTYQMFRSTLFVDYFFRDLRVHNIKSMLRYSQYSQSFDGWDVTNMNKF